MMSRLIWINSVCQSLIFQHTLCSLFDVFRNFADVILLSAFLALYGLRYLVKIENSLSEHVVGTS